MHANPVVYWELASHNAPQSVAFFRDVFGWEMQLDESSGIFELPAGPEPNGFLGGGVFTLKRAKLPFLTLYIRVQDIREKARQVQKHGGFIVEEPFEIFPGTLICLFNEPSGVTFAMLEKVKS